MIKLSGCIEMLFSEIDEFADRIPAAAQAGLPAFEFWKCSQKDIDAVVGAKDAAEIQIAAMAVEAPQGMLSLTAVEEFTYCTEAAARVAQRLGASAIIAITGWEDTERPRSEQHEAIVACLKAAAPIVEDADLTLVLEPLNILVDHAGYYLYESAEGFQIIDEVGSPNVKLLFDIYHQQVTEGNLIANITANIDKIGHFHAADVPGRNEPGTGEINWSNVVAAINDTDYDGYLGLEYQPTIATPKSLEFIQSVVASLE